MGPLEPLHHLSSMENDDSRVVPTESCSRICLPLLFHWLCRRGGCLSVPTGSLWDLLGPKSLWRQGSEDEKSDYAKAGGRAEICNLLGATASQAVPMSLHSCPGPGC